MKRILSLLLTIAMLASMMATTVFAAESSEDSPIDLTSDLLYEGDFSATVTVAAGETEYYCAYRVGGMIMTINDGEGVACTTDGMMMPYTWSITNDGEIAAAYVITVGYPVGSMDNPEVIDELNWSYNEVSLTEGDNDGYYYSYTAEADGSITLYFAYEVEGVEGDIVLMNNSTYQQLSLSADGVDNYGLEVTMDVSKGDEIIIQVLVQPDENWQIAAADFTWVGNFTYPQGSEQNPIYIEWNWDDEYANATAEVAVPAGETVYYVGNGQMILTVDGVEVEQNAEGAFSITNSGDADATYALALATPVGAYNNPKVIDDIVGFSDMNSLAEDQAYYYIWTAQEDTTVILDVSEGANLTVDRLTYTEDSEWPISEQFVLAEPEIDENWNYTGWIVSDKLVIDVVAGQELKIQVNGLTDWDTWMTPAVDYTLTAGEIHKVVAEAECASGDETVDVILSLADLELDNATSIKVEFACDDALELTAGQWLLDGELTDMDIEAGKAAWGADVAVAVNGDFMTLTFKAPDAVGEYGFQCDVTVKLEDEVLSNVIIDGKVNVTKKLFKLAGANMTLGNELAMNFFVNKSDIDSNEDYYIKVTKTYAEGRADVVKTFAEDQWGNFGNKYYVTFDGVAAKEMTDKIYVQVFCADGTPASEIWTDSVADYALRIMESKPAKTKTMLVDMLNYGSAAQTKFGYGEDNLASDLLTAAQKAYATQSATTKDYRVKGTNYHGSNLELGNSIILGLFFKNVDTSMYAIATYTDHNGNARTVRIEGSDFDHLTGNIYRVPVRTLAVADARQIVTCNVYKADGTLVGTCQDSMESYINRMSTKDALYEAIMKFAVSAYAYFHY